MKQGDVVIGAFPGARMTKTRPAVVLSSEDYHRRRPDVIVGVITTQTPAPWAPSDCELLDWRIAGLHERSYFRVFVMTLPQREVRSIGQLSERDFAAVGECFKAAFMGIS